MRAPLPPYLDRVRAELVAITADLQSLLDSSTIRNVDPNTDDSPVVIIGAAEWGWGPSDADMTATQMRLGARYQSWFERFTLLFPHPTPDVASKISDGDEFMRRWISRPDAWDHSIPRSIDLAKSRAAAELAAFDALLEVAAKSSTEDLRLVPDTNALIRNPDLASYARVAPSPTFIVHLLPTVLSELDKLKDQGKSQDLRDQAQAVVRRLKGLRDKGSLSVGVNVTRNVTVKAEAREVDVRAVLEWLDPAVPDDRLLAGALRLQSDHPAGSVVLVTSDLNLQNKADAAGLPYIETPPTTASLSARLVATLRWPSASGPPVVSLTNEGPATAKNVEFSISTMPDDGPMRSCAGPWTVDRLQRGSADERQVYGFYASVVLLNATWTDDDGPHEMSRPIDFPERPSTQPPPGRATR